MYYMTKTVYSIKIEILTQIWTDAITSQLQIHVSVHSYLLLGLNIGDQTKEITAYLLANARTWMCVVMKDIGNSKSYPKKYF